MRPSTFFRLLEFDSAANDRREERDRRQAELDALCGEFEQRYPQIAQLHASVQQSRVYVHAIQMKEGERGQGVGTAVIRGIQQKAQEWQLPIVLEPQAERGKKEALERFYRSLGFTWNRGRDKDYSISNTFGATMVWRPTKVTEGRRGGDRVVPKPEGLRELMREVTLCQDEDGYYVKTHRCRSDSYPSPEEIPASKIEFVGSTG